jgi:hypothetical protein
MQVGHSFVVISKDAILKKKFKLIDDFIELSVAQLRQADRNFPEMELSIDGYNDDARSLDKIPDVVSWFKELHRQYPYIPLFFVPSSIQVYYVILLPFARQIVPKWRSYGWDVPPKALLLHTFYERNKFFKRVLGDAYTEYKDILGLADRKVASVLMGLVSGK